jgi:hypothetical protein
MNFLQGYQSESDSEGDGDNASHSKSSHEQQQQQQQQQQSTFKSTNALFADLPPPRPSQQAASDESSQHTGRLIGSRLRPSASTTEVSLVQKFAPIDTDAVRERQLKLAAQQKEDEALEKELHGGSSLAQKRAASAAAVAAQAQGFSSFLPAPKRGKTVAIEDVLKPADAIELPARDTVTDAALASVPSSERSQTAPASKPQASFAQSLMADLEHAYSKTTPAPVYANPKFDPSRDFAAFDATPASTVDLPASFTGRHAASIDSMRSISATALLQKSSAESEMEAPKMGTEFTGFTPTESGRRRGALTYAAHVALSNQSQLEETWRAGSLKKKEARSKYGF